MTQLDTSLQRLRIGVGFDAHLFAAGRRLVLGGCEIPYDKGLAGHSDGDVLLHAIADALLGAMAKPDIGVRFPDNDPEYLDADSAVLLREVYGEMLDSGYRFVNLDCVVVCDEPKLGPHTSAIRDRIAAILGSAEVGKRGEVIPVESCQIGIKAKTTEGTNLVIPGQGIAALATVLLHQSK